MEHDEGKLRLWLTHRAALVDYASGVTGSRAEAEDVVQDAYLRFVPTPPTPSPGLGHPVAYLYRIVRNLAVDWTRRRGREAASDQALDQLVSPLADPERQAADRADLRQAARTLEEIPPQARAALVLHRLEGRTLQEVAARLGVSVPTAHRLVRDALLRLALSLEDRDV